MARFRQLKHQLQEQLLGDDWQTHLPAIADRKRDAVGPLLSFLMRGGELKWRAATALGRTVGAIADERMENARVIMRQFMWFLNEESGNMGWGVPESLAEAVAVHHGLAAEFGRILPSYIHDHKHSNYLDHPPLRFCAFWGVGRVAEVRPELMLPAVADLILGLEDEYVPSRGLAARALGLVAPHLDANARASAAPALAALVDESAQVAYFSDQQLVTATVGELARQAQTALNA